MRKKKWPWEDTSMMTETKIIVTDIKNPTILKGEPHPTKLKEMKEEMNKLTKNQIINKLCEDNILMEKHINFLYEVIDMQQEDKMKIEDENDKLKIQIKELKGLQ